ncbi:MAG: pitrilysin family protein [Planctomycetota bacterium]
MISLPALLLTGLALGGDDRAPSPAFAFPVERIDLDNGLRVLLQEDHSVPLITLHTFFRAGSRNESTGGTGIAHLIEHMMFNGAAKYGPKEFDRLIEAHGGYSNAYTDLDLTAYHETFFADGLDDVLDLELDRLSSLELDTPSFASETAVVREERRISSEEDVMGALAELLWACAFTAHSYHWPVIGWMSDLENVKPPQVQAFFDRQYIAANAIVVVAGDFTAAAVKPKIIASLGKLARRPLPDQPTTVEPPQKGERRCILRDTAELPAVELGWHVPAINEERNAALLVLSRLLAGSRTARLDRELVYGEELLQEASVEYTPTIDPGLFTIVARIAPGTSMAQGEQRVRQAIARFASDAPDEIEVERARNLVRMDTLNELATIEGRADVLGTYQLLFGDYQAVFRIEQHLAAVTGETLRAIVAEHCRDDNLTVASLIPPGWQEPEPQEGDAASAHKQDHPDDDDGGGEEGGQ